MAEPTVGSARFTEDPRGEHQFHPQPDENVPIRQSILKKNSVKRKSIVETAGPGAESYNSFLYSSIPTSSNPTETLVNRFNAWRRLLKDYITYFREVQSTSEAQARNLLKLSQTINDQSEASGIFMKSGGILENNALLRDFYKEIYLAAENAKSIESEIITQLTGLRGDLNLKVREIKALSGDFKNNVEKEKEATKKALALLQEAIQTFEVDPSNASGKNEPYIVRLHVENQIRRQLAEENYLHKAYLNLEASGRELERIVVGEIQKAFSTYSQIIKREGQLLVEAADKIEVTNAQLPQEREWEDFVKRDPSIIEPTVPLRRFEDIDYPGLHHTSTAVVREGELERRSKYLKSFTSGWYVLSSTHLHEFKSADRTNDLTPVMSLYLPDCTLGSHSEPTAVSHKFVLKGRQTGGMHTWTFRAETHAKLLEWYEDIKKLTELSGAGRAAFVASHIPTSTEGQHEEVDDAALLANDEADEIPYSSSNYSIQPASVLDTHKRPEVGRFPSDIRLDRGIQEARRPSSSEDDRYVLVSANPNDPAYPRHHSRSSSAFSYDETHPYTQALESKKEEVVPVMANIPPEVERKMSTRHDYGTNEQALMNRRNSSTRKLIHENETRTRSLVGRGPPSRKPTASYGYDPITGAPDQQAGLLNTSATGPSNASISSRDIHVPGDYPKDQ
ncbi:hypothetical protein EV426DRAFT_101618 [Tirmania nivea]|nr:hypothetical protein EV426DRAFT_101618 [Tirmania nivea]